MSQNNEFSRRRLADFIAARLRDELPRVTKAPRSREAFLNRRPQGEAPHRQTRQTPTIRGRATIPRVRRGESRP